MTIASAQTRFREISLDQLKVSNTGSQSERRKHFDKAAMAELVSSIKERGVEIPIITRAVNGHFEIIAGERRYLAAKTAGLAEVTCDVRSATDEQVLEIQLIENLQREGLHELAEAEGYEQLQKLGHSADEIADKVGKSRGYVYGRMKLLALCPDARSAFYDGKLNASTALLLARIPVESLQVKALKEIVNPRWGGETMSVRETQDLIHRDYMLQLSEAKFDTADETLVRGAVACGRCPKNTLSQPELFGDVKKSGSAGVCTDPGCFKAKREAAAEKQIAEAKAKGFTVITGKSAKDILGHGDWVSNHAYTKLSDRCHDDPKNRTYGQILGKDAEPILVQSPNSGDMIKVVKKSDAAKKLKDAGVVTASAKNKATAEVAKRDDKFEAAYRRAVFDAIIAKAPAKLGRHEIEACALALFGTGYGDDEPLFELLGWEVKNAAYSKGEKYFLDKIKAATDAGLAKIICIMLYRGEIEETYGPATVLTGEAKRLGIDTAKIKAAVKAELAAPAKPKATAKKKAKGKK